MNESKVNEPIVRFIDYKRKIIRLDCGVGFAATHARPYLFTTPQYYGTDTVKIYFDYIHVDIDGDIFVNLELSNSTKGSILKFEAGRLCVSLNFAFDSGGEAHRKASDIVDALEKIGIKVSRGFCL